jgi:energy-coupling factor transporter ATP-binding protein EcfA2
MVRIKQIRAKAVRGLRDLDLALDGKSLLLYGENGSGKSSLVDALELLFRGSIQHLEGTQGISVQRHGAHIELGREAVEITCTFDPGGVAITRTFETPPTIPHSLQAYWSDTTRTDFLRRAQLLHFIHADPADRFRLLGQFIGLDELDKVELSFMRARDQLQAARDAASNEIDRIRQRLASICPTGTGEPDDVLRALNKRAVGLGLAEIRDIDEIKLTTGLWRQSARQEDSEKIAQLTRLRTEAIAIDIGDLPSDLDEHRSAYGGWVQRRADLARLTEARFLEQGEEMLRARDIGTCPLCEQDFDRGQVLTDVIRRRRQLDALSSEFAAFRQQSGRLSTRLGTLAKRVRALVQVLWSEVDEDATFKRRLSDAADVVDRSAREVEESTTFESTPDWRAVKSSVQCIGDDARKLADAAAAKTNALAATETDKAIFALVLDCEQLNREVKELNRRSTEFEAASDHASWAAHVFESFSTCKKDEVRETYEAIEGDVNEYYRRLHPDDQHAEIQLRLLEGRRASSVLTMCSFGNEATDPRALTSEGHLDSLGVCIFLAFVKRFATASRLIVLDDVVIALPPEKLTILCGDRLG